MHERSELQPKRRSSVAAPGTGITEQSGGHMRAALKLTSDFNPYIASEGAFALGDYFLQIVCVGSCRKNF